LTCRWIRRWDLCWIICWVLRQIDLMHFVVLQVLLIFVFLLIFVWRNFVFHLFKQLFFRSFLSRMQNRVQTPWFFVNQVHQSGRFVSPPDSSDRQIHQSARYSEARKPWNSTPKSNKIIRKLKIAIFESHWILIDFWVLF
jgi:hypothetical protein